MPSKPNPIIHVWITKYALTGGLIEADAEHCIDIDERMVSMKGQFSKCFHRPDWHVDLPSARARVREMIAAKRKSLMKSLAKLDELDKEYWGRE